jgi:hypothetical protein
MTKRQLIDEIVSLNHSADPGFLAHFGDEDLLQYRDHLLACRRPRLSGDASRYAKYFAPRGAGGAALAEGAKAAISLPAVTTEVDVAERAALLSPAPPDAEENAEAPQAETLAGATADRESQAPTTRKESASVRTARHWRDAAPIAEKAARDDDAGADDFYEPSHDEDDKDAEDAADEGAHTGVSSALAGDEELQAETGADPSARTDIDDGDDDDVNANSETAIMQTAVTDPQPESGDENDDESGSVGEPEETSKEPAAALAAAPKSSGREGEEPQTWLF